LLRGGDIVDREHHKLGNETALSTVSGESEE
jgi:hypothetical protein